MKINEFQETIAATELGKALVGAMNPSKPTPQLANDLAAKLTTVALHAEAVGITLQYLCETAIMLMQEIRVEEEEIAKDVN